jgi:sulfatase maturation enzyme AslB (radical SAM superfamily)
MEMSLAPSGHFGSRRLSIELTNICNLHCSYCLRDEDALYNSDANFLSPDFLERIISEAQQVMGITNLVFTGGEPTLHPQFARILEIAESNGVRVGLVTNGWHFERVWPALFAHRSSIENIGFSIDGITRESHDRWRGEGSFIRLVKALARCYANKIPFTVKVVIRKDTVPNLEQIAIFAARMGATSLTFAHLLHTSTEIENSSGLSLEERRQAEQEIANLSRIFKMRIGIDVGYYNVDLSPPCSALAGVSANIDYLGRLSLCCNLSGFRGAIGDGDVVADLNVDDFASAFARLSKLASEQLETRRNHLTMLKQQGRTPDLNSASPCLFCLDTLRQLPWRQSHVSDRGGRPLPVLN